VQKDLKKSVGKELVYCKLCGEPSRNEICKACRMLKEVGFKGERGKCECEGCD